MSNTGTVDAWHTAHRAAAYTIVDAVSERERGASYDIDQRSRASGIDAERVEYCSVCHDCNIKPVCDIRDCQVHLQGELASDSILCAAQHDWGGGASCRRDSLSNRRINTDQTLQL